MGKGTKISIKAKGTASGVKKALSKILSVEVPEKVTPLREADFRIQQKKNLKNPTTPKE